MAFDREDRRLHQNSHTFYLSYQGPLPASNNVKVDITINEVLGFPLRERPIIRSYTEFSDLPDGPTVRVYAIEEIVVEKLVALSDRARTEPRDLYDLWYLITNNNLQVAELRNEIEAKLAFRRRMAVGIFGAIAVKEERLRRLWTSRLGHQMNDLPEFEDVFRSVQRTVRHGDFPE